ncbi:cell wall-binding repeat-containing protein [Clostridium sp. ASBs410]|nr:cell wall-binding repeat-containing protein [Clostridium sp. ASBs410]
MRMKRLLFIVAMMIFSLNMTSFAEERRPLGENETRPRWGVMNEEYLPRKNEWYHQYDGAWIYLDEDGYTLQNTWFHDPANGRWYYFDEYCYMLHDTTTPDGYYVGADGAWVKDGQAVIETVANK